MRTTDNDGIGIYKSSWGKGGALSKLEWKRETEESQFLGDDGTMQKQGQVTHGARGQAG